MTKLKSLEISITGKEKITHQQKMIGKNLRKVIQRLLLMFCTIKKEKYILLMFQKITQIVKNKLFF